MPRPRHNFHNVSIVIPAAGMGRRMKSYGPKPLIELGGGETVLSRQLSLFRSVYPSSDVVTVVGFESEKIIEVLDASVKVVENEMYENTNVLRSIGMGMRVVDHDSIIVSYGDLVFNRGTIDTLTTGGSAAIIDTAGRMEEDEAGCTICDGRITHLAYGLPAKWCHIVYLTGRELGLFKQVAWHVQSRKWFGYEALNYVIENGGDIRGIEPSNMRIVEIDSSRDIEKARQIV